MGVSEILQKHERNPKPKSRPRTHHIALRGGFQTPTVRLAIACPMSSSTTHSSPVVRDADTDIEQELTAVKGAPAAPAAIEAAEEVITILTPEISSSSSRSGVAADQLEPSEPNSFTPPGSPGGLQTEASVHDLFRSARDSFGGRLQPEEGDLEAIEHPVRKGNNRMVTAQDWTATETPQRASATPTLELDDTIVDVQGKDGEQPSQGSAEDVNPAAASSGGGETVSEISVVASAPGKVILFGEHAVVYGKTAVGAAVSDLRIVVTARCTEEPLLAIDLPDLAVNYRRSAQEVASSFGSALDEAQGASPAPPPAAHLELISEFVGDCWPKDEKKALVPLMFLAIALAPTIFLQKAGPGARGLSINAFSASLPVGAGLGSSAALCVATSAALTRLLNLIDTADGNGKGVAGFTSSGAGENKEGTVGRGIGDGDRDSRDTGDGRRPSPSELERINAWAYAGEVVLHGTPSGLDNTVSCYGGAIKFVKGMDGAKNVTESIAGFPPLPILLTNTLVPKDTRALVAGVRRLVEAHPAPTTATFDAIGAIATEFLERAAAGAATGGNADRSSPALTAECVGQLAEMNHRLLCALGVGHPALERVCGVASAHGCKSKLTGAGGGGCALTIISSGNGHAKASKADLVRDMKAEGFRCYESSLGGNGVLWHDKSVPTEFLAVAAGSSSSADEMEGRTGLRVCQSLEGNAGRGMGTERTVVIAAAAAAFGAVVLVGLAQRV